MPRLGVYVHVPFCLSKCAYCDFVSYAGRADSYDDYLAALLCEIETSGPARASTVYFGGGTPTLLGAGRLAELLAAIRLRFDVARDAEITCEANPDTITEGLLVALREAGFNRLSVGVQSFSDEVLTMLGRSHDSATARTAVALAREHFDNLGIDLIFGAPGESAQSWRESLAQAVDLAPDHISAYCLTVEDKTALARRIDSREVPSIDDDVAAELMEITQRELPAAGYEHYEISNFARNGKRCAHNVDCWRYADYVGFGVAAHSKLGAMRFANHTSLDRYIAALPGGNGPQRVWAHSLSANDQAVEATILGLRMREGLPAKRFEEMWRLAGIEMSPALDRFSRDGLLNVGELISLTDRGLLVANEVFREFV